MEQCCSSRGVKQCLGEKCGLSSMRKEIGLGWLGCCCRQGMHFESISLNVSSAAVTRPAQDPRQGLVGWRCIRTIYPPERLHSQLLQQSMIGAWSQLRLVSGVCAGWLLLLGGHHDKIGRSKLAYSAWDSSVDPPAGYSPMYASLVDGLGTRHLQNMHICLPKSVVVQVSHHLGAIQDLIHIG
ncbi:hypothetical protein BV25DRAFT_957395 [Artomyces pyxidatus]|uniref:Uncharacterized protein n=1 Tax=Artomyces pyxidatus TaxID=48021 RepID=A0ACB8SUW7_9AGAM|nr:hypothetical protein BV25DRAFT_957395 [Artomyces pyxidatus]